jgi:rhodanese-related sulfurtransferase
MSKHRKRREAPGRASDSLAPSGRDSHSAGGRIFSRQIPLQLLALVGLSCALGFTFNAASPVGVRFGEPAASLAPVEVAPVQVVAVTNPPPVRLLRSNLVVPPPPRPVAVATITPPPKPSPPLPVAKTNAPATPWSVSVSPGITNPVKPVAPPPPAPANPTPIHWVEAKALAAEGRGVLVDVRHKGMFDAGHIPGAIALPENSPPEEFRTFLSKQATNVVLIVYCSSTSCSQSARVATRLVTEFHWPAVRYMTGGYQEYQQLELAKPAPPSPP